jgi:hypothetical protein
MTPDRWRELKEALDRLAGLSAEERTAALAALCARDPQLGDAAARLLAATPPDDIPSVPPIATPAPIAPGTRLGPYEVMALLGRGGMGEVWRARDTTLRREVALKVLPASMAQDAHRLARFRREAQLLASLNHPHIGSIYGFEEGGSSPALVLELVEGQTLATRLRRGPLPVEEALRLGAEIAEALEAAHERGVVHRDLKPGNVMQRTDGTVKVLDFGLATALRAEDADVTATALPTAGFPVTHPGLVMGTPAYMSPEQARGEPVDRRADIWAFGCVLYEMLTGRAAFGASTVTGSLARVLEGRVDLDALPPDTPSSVHRLVRRCLERLPRNRLQHIGDARADIADALAHELADAAAPGALRRPSSGHAVTTRVGGARRIVAIGSVLVVVAAVAAFLYFRTSGPAAGGEEGFSLQTARVERLTITGDASLPAITPDGRYVAYVRTDRRGDSLWLRQMTAPTAEEIVPPRAGSRILAVTMSPDGADFVVREGDRNSLERVPLVGGRATIITDNVHSSPWRTCPATGGQKSRPWRSPSGGSRSAAGGDRRPSARAALHRRARKGDAGRSPRRSRRTSLAWRSRRYDNAARPILRSSNWVPDNGNPKTLSRVSVVLGGVRADAG